MCVNAAILYSYLIDKFNTVFSIDWVCAVTINVNYLLLFFLGSGRGENDIEIRGRSRNARRDDPRRHTLAGDQQYGGMAGQGGSLARTMDLEVYI